MRALLLVLVLVLLIACVGCAFEPGYLRTSNPVVGSVEQSQGRGQTFSVTVEDARNDKGRIGIKKNGYGQETASVYGDASVDTWLRDSFAATLVEAGYKPAGADMPAMWRMRLRVLDVFTENTPMAFDVQYGARVSIELVVTMTDGRTWARRFTGLEMESRFIEAKVETPMQELLHRACQEAMGKAVRALTEISVASPQDRGY